MGAILSSVLLRYPQPYSSAWSTEAFCKETGTALPKRLHVVLDAGRVGGKHVAVIGDVHGCLVELKELMYKLEQVTDGNCFYVFCGDIINKGPLNKATLDYIRSFGDNVLVVRGNHEDHVIKNYMALKSDRACDLKKKYDWIASLTEDDLEYLKELPYTISIPSLNAIVVHAGLNPWTSLYHQTPLNMTKMRNISGVGIGETVQISEVGQGYPWASLWPGPVHVYFGHDAKRGLQRYSHATGLDTGCLYGNFLTAKLLTGSGDLIQVRAKDVYVVPDSAKKKLNIQTS